MKKLRLSEVWCPAQKTSQLVRNTARNTIGLAKMFIWIFPWDLTYSQNVLTFVYLYLQTVSQDSFSEMEILDQRCNLCSFYNVLRKVKVLVTHSCLTLCDPMDGSPPYSSVHGILQAVLEWVAIPFSTASSWPRDQTQVSCIAGGFFTLWAARGAPQGLRKAHPILAVSRVQNLAPLDAPFPLLSTHTGLSSFVLLPLASLWICLLPCLLGNQGNSFVSHGALFLTQSPFLPPFVLPELSPITEFHS